MNSTEAPRRGEIWLAAMGAARSGEPGKTRPVVVVSPSEFLVGSSREAVVTVPLSASARPAPLRPSVSRESGVERDSVALARSVRGIARGRLLKRLGDLSSGELRALDRALFQAIGIGQPAE